MSIWKGEALQKYKEECFKQTMPYQFELAYVDESDDYPEHTYVQGSATIIKFPSEDYNVLNFEGINTEYIIFVSQDGVAEEDLDERLIGRAPKLSDIIYCDEDFVTDINADLSDINVRIRSLRTPWRKPEYSPDTLLSFPYIETCFAIRTNFARSVPAIKQSAEISDNVRVWDFLLRAVERTNRIAHVGQVLYHRDLISLMGTDIDEKSISDEDIYKALMEVYARPGYQLCREAASKRRGVYTEIANENEGPVVSIIIPSKDNPEMLKECIRKIRVNCGNIKIEIIIVDNGSSNKNKEEVERMVRHMPEGLATYLYEPFDFDFARMCNIGAAEAIGSYLLFMNDDVDADCDKFIEKLLDYAKLPHVGAVGCKLLYSDNSSIQHIGITDINKGPTHKLMTMPDSRVYYYGRNHYVWNVLAVTGACLMINREKFFQVGGFNDKLKIGYNDVDLCVKLLESGYFNLVNNDCVLIHHESISRGKDSESVEKTKRLNEERAVYYDAHPWLKNSPDPFYSYYLDMDTIEIRPVIVPDYQITDYRNKVKILDKLPARPSDKVRFTIEDIGIERAIADGAQDAYTIEGWAITEKGNNALYKRYLVFVPLDDDGELLRECTVCTMSPKYRTDVREVFPHAVNTNLAGFIVRIPKDQLIRGRRYRLGVCFKKLSRFGRQIFTLGDIYEPGRGIITED